MARTLTVALAADIDGLRKGLKDAEKVVENSKDQIADFGKKAAAAFAVAGAAATAFAISAVKNAAADQAAQRKLEETIRASTKATAEQTAAVASYIDKTSIAIGVTDDQLRPALARLVRSTNDVQKAQDLLNLALDVSAATGKPLQTVADGLGKAYDGNTASLGRLGLGLDQNLIKSKDFNAIYQTLTATFGNFAENEALTTEKQFARIQIAVDEAKESIGAALLPVVDRLAKFTLETLVPALNALVAGLVGQNSVDAGITEVTEGAYNFGQQLRSTVQFIISIKEELIALGGIIATVFVANKIVAFVTAIQTLVAAMKTLRTAAAGAAVATAFATGGTSVGAAALALTAVAATYGLSKFAAGGDEEGGSAFTYGAGNPMFGLPTGGTGVGAFGGVGGFGGGGAGGGGAGGAGGGGGAGQSSFDKMMADLRKNTDKLKSITNDTLQNQARLDVLNNIILANAQPDEDQLRAQRLAAITMAAMRAEDPAAFGITNNIYVSGTIVDPEGLNRVLNDIQTQSDGRGTTIYGRPGGL